MTVYILAMAARQEVGLSGPLRLTPAREHLAVAVLVLLPRAQAIADKILARAAAIAKPVVVNFLGQGSADVNPEGALPQTACSAGPAKQ
ncbi:hypothetical protein [Marinobacter sp. LV10R520-4]|uniref:hypothetical protein n=1 Tax=Marinobacter sp. LV10R520-4 TaxID=1761796 RepID=UPI000BF8D788|nr:hypothetical protein [Marinobacter sp. LV10R520-4]